MYCNKALAEPILYSSILYNYKKDCGRIIFFPYLSLPSDIRHHKITAKRVLKLNEGCHHNTSYWLTSSYVPGFLSLLKNENPSVNFE